MTTLIKNIPNEERPREKLLLNGSSNLSNEELLAIILETGTRNKSVKDIALELLSVGGGISNLRDINYKLLCSIKGIGQVKAIKILSVIELSKRMFLGVNKKKLVLNNPLDIYQNCRYIFYNKKQEYFYCLYLNSKKELIERKLLFMGTVDRSIIHPREVFKEAYLLSASAIVCIHNHPSHDIIPSSADYNLTASLIEIGRLQGIPLIDHLIVTDNNYYSFYENNKELNW